MSRLDFYDLFTVMEGTENNGTEDIPLWKPEGLVVEAGRIAEVAHYLTAGKGNKVRIAIPAVAADYRVYYFSRLLDEIFDSVSQQLKETGKKLRHSDDQDGGIELWAVEDESPVEEEDSSTEKAYVVPQGTSPDVVKQYLHSTFSKFGKGTVVVLSKEDGSEFDLGGITTQIAITMRWQFSSKSEVDDAGKFSLVITREQ